MSSECKPIDIGTESQAVSNETVPVVPDPPTVVPESKTDEVTVSTSSHVTQQNDINTEVESESGPNQTTTELKKEGNEIDNKNITTVEESETQNEITESSTVLVEVRNTTTESNMKEIPKEIISQSTGSIQEMLGGVVGTESDKEFKASLKDAAQKKKTRPSRVSLVKTSSTFPTKGNVANKGNAASSSNQPKVMQQQPNKSNVGAPRSKNERYKKQKFREVFTDDDESSDDEAKWDVVPTTLDPNSVKADNKGEAALKLKQMGQRMKQIEVNHKQFEADSPQDMKKAGSRAAAAAATSSRRRPTRPAASKPRSGAARGSSSRTVMKTASTSKRARPSRPSTRAKKNTEVNGAIPMAVQNKAPMMNMMPMYPMAGQAFNPYSGPIYAQPFNPYGQPQVPDVKKQKASAKDLAAIVKKSAGILPTTPNPLQGVEQLISQQPQGSFNNGPISSVPSSEVLSDADEDQDRKRLKEEKKERKRIKRERRAQRRQSREIFNMQQQPPHMMPQMIPGPGGMMYSSYPMMAPMQYGQLNAQGQQMIQGQDGQRIPVPPGYFMPMGQGNLDPNSNAGLGPGTNMTVSGMLIPPQEQLDDGKKSSRKRSRKRNPSPEVISEHAKPAMMASLEQFGGAINSGPEGMEHFIGSTAQFNPEMTVEGTLMPNDPARGKKKRSARNISSNVTDPNSSSPPPVTFDLAEFAKLAQDPPSKTRSLDKDGKPGNSNEEERRARPSRRMSAEEKERRARSARDRRYKEKFAKLEEDLAAGKITQKEYAEGIIRKPYSPRGSKSHSRRDRKRRRASQDGKRRRDSIRGRRNSVRGEKRSSRGSTSKKVNELSKPVTKDAKIESTDVKKEKESKDKNKSSDMKDSKDSKSSDRKLSRSEKDRIDREQFQKACEIDRLREEKEANNKKEFVIKATKVRKLSTGSEDKKIKDLLKKGAEKSVPQKDGELPPQDKVRIVQGLKSLTSNSSPKKDLPQYKDRTQTSKPSAGSTPTVWTRSTLEDLMSTSKVNSSKESSPKNSKASEMNKKIEDTKKEKNTPKNDKKKDASVREKGASDSEEISVREKTPKERIEEFQAKSDEEKEEEKKRLEKEFIEQEQEHSKSVKKQKEIAREEKRKRVEQEKKEKEEEKQKRLQKKKDEKESHRDKESHREKDKKYDEKKEKEKDRERKDRDRKKDDERDRDRKKDDERERDRDKEKERERKDRDRKKDEEKDRDRKKDEEKDRDRKKDDEKDRDRKKDEERRSKRDEEHRGRRKSLATSCTDKSGKSKKSTMSKKSMKSMKSKKSKKSSKSKKSRETIYTTRSKKSKKSHKLKSPNKKSKKIIPMKLKPGPKPGQKQKRKEEKRREEENRKKKKNQDGIRKSSGSGSSKTSKEMKKLKNVKKSSLKKKKK